MAAERGCKKGERKCDRKGLKCTGVRIYEHAFTFIPIQSTQA